VVWTWTVTAKEGGWQALIVTLGIPASEAAFVGTRPSHVTALKELPVRVEGEREPVLPAGGLKKGGAAATPTASGTATASATATATPSPTPSATPSPTPSATATATPSGTPTATPTTTGTCTATPTPTGTVTPTSTATLTFGRRVEEKVVDNVVPLVSAVLLFAGGLVGALLTYLAKVKELAVLEEKRAAEADKRKLAELEAEIKRRKAIPFWQFWRGGAGK
jgi:hypothetical protein